MKKLFVLAVILTMFVSNSSFGGNITGTVSNGSKGIINAVIYLSNTWHGTYSGTGTTVKMHQKNMLFSPHVLPILVGATVEFTNEDNTMHNVYSPDACAENFNLGSWPEGEIRSYTFNKADCIATILCNLHPEMEAYILTLSVPYFAVSGKGGSFKIKNVPAGTYTLKIWSEKYNISDVQVTVPESGDVNIDI